MLSLVKTQGNQQKVGELFAKLPGADELAPTMAATARAAAGFSACWAAA